MKSLKQNYRGFLAIAAVSLTFMLAGASQSYADYWGPHYRYNDRDGYWDNHHHYHGYTTYRSHRGYWDDRGGVRVFISL